MCVSLVVLGRKFNVHRTNLSLSTSVIQSFQGNTSFSSSKKLQLISAFSFGITFSVIIRGDYRWIDIQLGIDLLSRHWQWFGICRLCVEGSCKEEAHGDRGCAQHTVERFKTSTREKSMPRKYMRLRQSDTFLAASKSVLHDTRSRI